jgi:hypothetical protein
MIEKDMKSEEEVEEEEEERVDLLISEMLNPIFKALIDIVLIGSRTLIAHDEMSDAISSQPFESNLVPSFGDCRGYSISSLFSAIGLPCAH